MIHTAGEIQNFVGGGMDSRWILVFWDQMGINQRGSNRQFSNFDLLESDGILIW